MQNYEKLYEFITSRRFEETRLLKNVQISFDALYASLISEYQEQPSLRRFTMESISKMISYHAETDELIAEYVKNIPAK